MVCRNQVLVPNEDKKNRGCEIRCERTGSKRKSWDSIFDIALHLIEKHFTSKDFRHCVSFFLFMFIAIFIVHYLILGALELNGTRDEESLYIVKEGLISSLWMMASVVVAFLCACGFFGVVWKHKIRCSCSTDMKLLQGKMTPCPYTQPLGPKKELNIHLPIKISAKVSLRRPTLYFLMHPMLQLISMHCYYLQQALQHSFAICN